MDMSDEYLNEFIAEYYLLGGRLARLWYDVEADEYAQGEILYDYGIWRGCPVSAILSAGDEISLLEAEEHAKARGHAI